MHLLSKKYTFTFNMSSINFQKTDETISEQSELILTLENTEEIKSQPSTPVKNMPFDELLDVDIDFHSTETLEISDGTISSPPINILPPSSPVTILPPQPPSDEDEVYGENIIEETFEPKSVNKGNGIMNYIDDKHTREMLENAWRAINLTETWDFVAQPIDSFMMSNDKRILVITRKMEELGYKGHSGFTFGWTMRNMQFIAQYGIEKFKEGV